MKKKFIITIGIILSLVIVFTSCDEDGNETLISSHYDNESHNNGKNCMSCHKSGESGEGWFTVAGSVYDSLKTSPLPNGTIRLYSETLGSGTLVKTIDVDGKGNFYTTEKVDFAEGLYVSITGSSGNIKNMYSSISTGQCNSCHGVSTDRIWVN